MNKSKLKVASGAILVIALALAPLIISDFFVYLVSQVIIFSVFGVSFYLLLGHTGLLSFGHAAYFGIGAYTTALCLIHLPRCPVLLSILVGSLSALVGGLIVASFILRLTKIYFALATLAFGQMIWALAWKWRGLTGGDDGLVGWTNREIFLPLLGQYSISHLDFLYYLICTFSVASIVACWLFTKTPLGNSLASLKSNPDRAQFLGVNVYLAKYIVFSFSALIAGIAGSLYALFDKMVSPHVADMFMSFDVVIISVIGGYSSFIGPIIGSFFYICMGEYLSSLTEKWELIMGGLFILIILFYPNGLAGMFKVLLSRKAVSGAGSNE